MQDSEEKKDKPAETYVGRTARELSDLGFVFRQNWILGVCIIFVLAALGAYKIGLLDKKDDKKDANAEIVKMADQYVELNQKYQRLQQDVQQKSDADKEAEIASLKAKIDEQQTAINSKAQAVGGVMVPDPTAYGGHRLIPASAVDAWTECVHNSAARSVSANATFGPFSFGGSSSTSNDRCDAILQQAGIH